MGTRSINERIKRWLALAIFLLFSYGVSTTLFQADEASYQLKGSYFNTQDFTAELDDFMELFAMTQLDYVDLETAKKQVTVDQDEIEQQRRNIEERMNQEFGEVRSEYDAKLTDAQQFQDTAYVTQLLQQRDAATAEVKKKYTKTDEELIQQIKEEKYKELEAKNQKIENAKSRFTYKSGYLTYYFQDKAGNLYTNIAGSRDQLEGSSFFYRDFPYHTKLNDNLMSVNNFFITREISGFIAVPNDPSKHSLIVENMYDYQDSTRIFLMDLAIHLSALIVSLIAGLKYRRQAVAMVMPYRETYGKIPLDIRILAMLFVSLMLLVLSENWHYGGVVEYLFFSLVVAVWLAKCVWLWPTFRSAGELRLQWQGSLLYKLKRELAGSFLSKNLLFQLLGLLGVTFMLGFGSIFTARGVDDGAFVVYLLFLLVCGSGLLFYLLKKAAYFNSLLRASEQIAAGENGSEIKVKGSGVLARLAANLNRMKQGVDLSQKAQAKSERLKTELISNVSHDLRTPLTSIMNYTGFLKNKELSEEERDSYIDIIDQKSKRLKVLIDDLFEVSKMASGDIELSLENADVVQLLQQALGEFNEQIRQSSLEFKVSSSHPHMYVRVDGKKIWRVFENIIGNILKYSLEHTRVYISTVESEAHVTVTFKNISKYDLKENTDELFERFKRGDESRHTEGSGLGLAIAKSIVDHHGGRLDIELDGDLFKAIVVLKK